MSSRCIERARPFKKIIIILIWCTSLSGPQSGFKPVMSAEVTQTIFMVRMINSDQILSVCCLESSNDALIITESRMDAACAPLQGIIIIIIIIGDSSSSSSSCNGGIAVFPPMGYISLCNKCSFVDD